MIDQDVKLQLSQYMERLIEPIEITASVNESEHGKNMRSFLTEVADCSSKITLKWSDDLPRTPSFAIGKVGDKHRVFFAGIPMGHEFTSLILALLQVSGYPPKVSTEVIERIQQLSPTAPLHFEVFVSLSCHNCPDVVQAVNLIAAQNNAVSATMIDGALFQEEVNERGVMAVPMLFCNGNLVGQGRMEVEEILSKVDTEAGKKMAATLSAKDPYDLLVVGGGPAGASAAIYAARKGIRTGIVTERFGGQVLDTLSIENYISIQQTEGGKLAASLEAHTQQYDVEIIKAQSVNALVPANDEHVLHRIGLANGAELSAKTVVLSTGARWREMNVPGESDYKGKGVCFCPHCDGPLYKNKPVAVIGGGNSGAEAAIDLAGIVSHVTLIEFDTVLRADAVLQKKLQSLANVTVILNALTTEVVGDGKQVTGLIYEDRSSKEKHTVTLAGIFVQIGLLPNTEWLKDVIELSPRGEVEINHRGETNIPGIVAAGDCTTTPFKQIVIACGEGARASLAAFDHMIRN